MAILSLGKEASLEFWGSLEDAKADCAAVAAAAAESAVIRNDGGAADESLAGSDAPGPPVDDSGVTETDQCQGRRKAVARRALALASVRCEDCSLVVFEGPAYYDAWHGIASTVGDSGGAPATEAVVAEAAAYGEGGSNSGQAAAGAQATAPSYSSSGGGMLGVDVGRDREAGAGQKRLSFTIRRVARVVPADSVMEHPEARSEMERRRRGFERSVTETGVAAVP